jgi:hypothetical protein
MAGPGTGSEQRAGRRRRGGSTANVAPVDLAGEREEKLRLAIEVAQMGTWEVDLVRDVATQSDQVERIFGVVPGAPMGSYQAFMARVHPDDRDRVGRALTAAVEGGAPYHAEFRIQRPDGDIRWVIARGQTYRNEAGQAVRMVGVIQDLTERKKAEEALRESESAFRRVLDTALDAVIRIDATGTITEWNPQAEAIFGWRREEILGRSLAETIIPPEYRDAHERGLKRYLDTGSGPLLNRRIEIRAQRRGGEILPVELAITPLAGAGGSVAFNAFLRDITERRRTEEALRASEERFRQLAEEARLIPWEADARTWRFTYVGPKAGEILGYPLEQWYAAGFWGEHIHPEDRQRALEFCGSSMQNRDNYEFEYRMLGANGESVWLHDIVNVVRDPQGPARLRGFMIDITERKRAEEEIRRLNAELESRVVERTAQLEEANRELEAFAYSASHDLRAPLRAVDGFSQALLEDYAPALDATAQGYLQRVRAATQGMGQLIDDLLALSRVVRAPLNRRSVDLSAAVKEILARLRDAEPGRKLDLVVAEGISAAGDPALLRILVDNLLRNAWKFTSRRPRARIEFGTAAQEGGQRVFFVKDNGVGFDMAYAEKLFTPFQRLHAASEFPGTGVGLATVQRIAACHGGRVRAQGEVDRGSTFYFTLGPEA